MKHLYAPQHTVEQYITTAAEHEGHTVYAAFTDGRGSYKWQRLVIEAVGLASNQMHIISEHTSAWFPVADLWSYGTPQCMTCEG